VVASSGKRNSSFLGMARKSIGRLWCFYYLWAVPPLPLLLN
jgi:hypothetical protein